MRTWSLSENQAHMLSIEFNLKGTEKEGMAAERIHCVIRHAHRINDNDMEVLNRKIRKFLMKVVLHQRSVLTSKMFQPPPRF